MAIFLAFLAACALALGTVWQQKGTLDTAAGARDPRFLVQILRRPAWLAGGALIAAAIVTGTVLFLAGGSPHGGTSHPGAAAWWPATAAAIVAAGVLAGLGRHRAAAAQALLLGSAAGVVFALQAAVTKVFAAQPGHGLAALPRDWAAYALIASAAAGFVLQQSALKTAVLAPAIAASNTMTLLASVILGLTRQATDCNISAGRCRARYV